MRLVDNIKQFLKRKLISGQKRILDFLDIWVCRVLSYKFILILGCQRSGTTLLYMLLTSHPLVTGRDEKESHFSFPKKGELFSNYIHGKITCFKLPTKTPELSLIQKKFPFATILWITRKPLSVVSSMKSLTMTKDGNNWLQACGRGELQRHSILFPEINNINFEKINEVELGAYIWKYKNMTCDKYKKSKLKTFVIEYELLVKDPKEALIPILENIGLFWNERLLKYDDVHRDKEYLGGNMGNKPLDKSRIEPKLCLDGKEIEIVNSITKTSSTKDTHA